ncbi:hypothetical protein [Robertkochia sediminum]|uniref:hypothetical protein n=1 Tax=Robertkochia sediminum TaxID=2785326 RepID=UPI001931A991|nr:hypothetical protein [Robertkochia sediminum]MBL7473428.1 hypothetical protein [Robertkochia sediminum]
MKTRSLVAFLFFAGAVCSFAQSTPKVDQRQKIQKARTIEGVKSGELTKAEAKSVVAGQKKVNRMEARAKSDGKVTRRERKRLQQAQNRSSRNIARKKNNERSRS